MFSRLKALRRSAITLWIWKKVSLQEVMRVYRPLKICAGCCWCAGCCDCCAQETQVESPPGVIIGRVKQTGGKCNYNYEVQDVDGNAQLRIEGPCIMCRCCADVEFPVSTPKNARHSYASAPLRVTITAAGRYLSAGVSCAQSKYAALSRKKIDQGWHSGKSTLFSLYNPNIMNIP